MNRAANINIVESLLRTVDKISEKQKHEKDEKKMHFRSSERLKDKNKIIPSRNNEEKKTN